MKWQVLHNPYVKTDRVIATKPGYYMFHHPWLKKCTLMDVCDDGKVITWEGRPGEARDIIKLGELIVEKRVTIRPTKEKRKEKGGVL